MKLFQNWLALCIWIILGILVIPTTFAHDSQQQANDGYDGTIKVVLRYDGDTVLSANENTENLLGSHVIFFNFVKFLAAEGGAYSAIGSTGQVGEQWLAQNLGGESQVFFNTTQGGRYVDQLVGDIANESKVGYQSLTPSIQLQISKDAELLNGGTFQSVNWHFFQSPVTGLGGPSQPLMNALQQNGINVIIH